MYKAFKGLWSFHTSLHPVKLALVGYLSYIIAGCILLWEPFSQKGVGTNVLDCLFISTSAVSTTGLATVSIADNFNLFGQVVILLLIQLGGIGYMTFSSFVVLSASRNLSEARTGVAKTVFSLPSHFRVDKFIRSVIIFTLVIETTAALALYAAFLRRGADNPVWSAIFHSVSSFCTAGFSIYNSSFEGFADDFWLNAIVSATAIFGAVGFIVFVDVWRRITHKEERITLTSRIILYTTLWLTIIGTFLFFVSEPSVQVMPGEKRLLASFFQTMTAMTTVGFNTINISAISHASLLLLAVLMVIGASPSGTGGGLKSTTFAAVVGVMVSAMRGKHEVRFWGRKVPDDRLQAAVASLGFYLGTLLVGTYLLALTEVFPFENLLFEAASALGTVGLSTGITPDLSDLGKFIITLLMFVGRIGPLTFGLALAAGTPKVQTDEDLAI